MKYFFIGLAFLIMSFVSLVGVSYNLSLGNHVDVFIVDSFVYLLALSLVMCAISIYSFRLGVKYLVGDGDSSNKIVRIMTSASGVLILALLTTAISLHIFFIGEGGNCSKFFFFLLISLVLAIFSGILFLWGFSKVSPQ